MSLRAPSSRSLSLCLLTLSLVGWTTTSRADATGPGKMVEVKEDGAPTIVLPLDDVRDERQVSFAWDDSSAEAGAPPDGAAGYVMPTRATGAEAKAPTVIAAPLPPALLPGLIGLAGVYAYKRRHGLR